MRLRVEEKFPVKSPIAAKFMKLYKFIFILSFCLVVSPAVFAQTTPKVISLKTLPSPQKSSPAYAEVLLRKTERESELEELLINYTDEFPKVKELRLEISLLQLEMDKILDVNGADTSRLTLALGKLIVRTIELKTDLWNLRRQYSDDHIEVKRARRKIEIYDKAVKEILP